VSELSETQLRDEIADKLDLLERDGQGRSEVRGPAISQVTGGFVRKLALLI
jgi:hypothetical protein